MLLLWPVVAPAQDEPGPAEIEALVQQAQPGVRPRLQAVLEQAPADQPVPWSDDASGLGGDIVTSAASFDGRPCRAIRYTVRRGGREVAVDGRRCREPDGLWVAGPAADRISVVPLPSPLIGGLEAALHRLAYYQGAIDGIPTPGFTRALLAFERDEQVPPEAEPTPDLLRLADAAIGRIPTGGECPPDGPVPDGTSVACGGIR